MGKLSKFLSKSFSRFTENILFIETLVLLAFIPLYPKLPLLDVKNTWVYIRIEDFLVVFVILSWLILLVKQKITLKTPLTIPIIIFWLVGVIATIHGVLLVFPTLANIFPNVAFLAFLRHVEYISLFFVTYAGIRDKKQLKYVVGVLIATIIGVIIYGFGQKYLGFPAYLTMNEEFAKGIPITLSGLSRIPSTFGGHYDLAAYLVLIIPILVSLIFGIKNWFVKTLLLITSLFGVGLLFMTVSRVSFFVLFIALLIVVFFQKRKLVLLSLPLIGIFGIAILASHSSLLSRFQSTVSETEVLIDAQTGDALGNVKFVPREYFKDKLVFQRRVKDKEELAKVVAGESQDSFATSSAIFRYEYIPQQVPFITAIDVPTGENLPQGTGYINLTLSPVTKRVGNFFYELPPDFKASLSAQILVLHGDFIVKRASAYDLSFTTRFQGEWPRAIEAFTRNILVGSGYGSVSLAVDNNYLRILAETGLLGFLSFILIFLTLGIYMRKIFPDIDSLLAKSFVIGFGAGLIGLFLNAALIDVFEASKIAFLLWILMGVTFGLLKLYQKNSFSLLNEIKKVALSPYAIIIYLFLFSFVLFSPTLNNFFVGDDFTWLRWAAQCRENCGPVATILHYFTNSDGFFYRPGTKIYFHLMYEAFWLNQVVYHFVSLLLHFSVASLFYLMARRVLKSNILGAMSAFLFVVMSGSVEGVLWISATGHLFTAFFGLLGLLLFINWDEKRKPYYLVFSFISFALAPLFHELGVFLPLLVPAYMLLKDNSLGSIKKIFKRLDYLILFIPVLIYFVMRLISHSHWFNGDYSYDLVKLPFNFFGNAFGYVFLVLLGPIFLSAYEAIRNIMRENIMLSIVIIPVFLGVLYGIFRWSKKVFNATDRKIIIFGLLFFIISLLPFIALGNITSRYSYLASLGLILIFVLLLKKVYIYLEKSGREVAIGFTSVVILVFALFHIIQIQQTYFEWREAGVKVTKFFVSIEELYDGSWSKNDVEFRFVNVPIKVGEAWIFPVGLPDAVWFAFRNDNAKVFLDSDVNSAMQLAGFAKSHFILKFNTDGSVKQIDRSKYIRDHLIKPQ
ncbi:MAG: hypothetical protein AAB520_00675 [Patescibacteria group bacterium]